MEIDFLKRVCGFLSDSKSTGYRKIVLDSPERET